MGFLGKMSKECDEDCLVNAVMMTEYARQAIQLVLDQYLLKPATRTAEKFELR